MPPASPGAREGLAIAVGVLILTAIFLRKQWADRQDRADDLPAEDALYFARRDTRRWAGTAILGLIGIGMFFGSWLEPRVHRLGFLATWIMVGGLVIVSLVLALIDWVANRAYAVRHIQQLAEERRRMLEAEIKRRKMGRDVNGHGEPAKP